jgi:hypothetical protein
MWRAAVVLLSACGSLATPPDASTSVDATTDVADTLDAGGCFVCPSALPSQGGACTSMSDAAAACEYGDFATGDCSSLATCADAGWSLRIPPMPQCANSVECPSAFDAAAPNCAASALRCDYAAGRCGCELAGEGGLVWTCDTTTDPAPARPPPHRFGLRCAAGMHLRLSERVQPAHGHRSPLRLVRDVAERSDLRTAVSTVGPTHAFA